MCITCNPDHFHVLNCIMCRNVSTHRTVLHYHMLCVFSILLFLAFTAANAAILMMMETMNVAENVAGGSVTVCAEINGVTGMLECEVVTTATILGNGKAGRKL